MQWSPNIRVWEQLVNILYTQWRSHLEWMFHISFFLAKYCVHLSNVPALQSSQELVMLQGLNTEKEKG
jgi:hypothetical protein